ncbi:MAG TPA: toxin-antitoxin system HicB family antitoxin [Actinomycetota bacterium]
MDLTPHIEALRGDLDALTAGDEQVRATFERLGRALEPAVQLRFIDALGEASLELSDQLPMGRTEVRVAGRDATIVYVGPTPAEPDSAAEPEEDEGGTARLTLRMPESLKSKVEEAATREGLSVNAWLVRAIQRGLEGRRFEFEIGKGRGSGTRLTGYAQS